MAWAAVKSAGFAELPTLGFGEVIGTGDLLVDEEMVEELEEVVEVEEVKVMEVEGLEVEVVMQGPVILRKGQRELKAR